MLAPVWLCAFGAYLGYRNYCDDTCDQPVFRPHDHWSAWVGTAIGVGLVWGATYAVGAWRRSALPLAGRVRWLARSSPAIFAAAIAGGCYAVLAQDTIAAGKPWAYTGGTVWLWLIPSVIGLGLLVANVLALRPEWEPTDGPTMLGLATLLALGAGYVTWAAL